MKRSFRLRKIANLSESVERRLNLYALAASAAGVGMLAQPAQAKIVYTPANLPITNFVSLDLNHDGIADFSLHLYAYGAEAVLGATSIGQNRVWGATHTAAHLRAGVLVGPGRKKWVTGGVCYSSRKQHLCKALQAFRSFSGFPTSTGVWSKFQKGYLGLKFYIQGKVHFGWARLQRDTRFPWVVTGYAYETTPGKAIIAGATKASDDTEAATSLDTHTPAPATLGALALGAPGMSIWRREESVGTPAFRSC